MSRDDFLARVRKAADAGRRYRVSSGPPGGSRVGYVGAAPDEIVDRFCSEVTLAGGLVHRLGPHDFVSAALETIVRQHRVRSAVCWSHPLLDDLRFGVALASCGVAPLWPDELAAAPLDERQARLLAADLGVTAVDFAIAETGTLAVFASPRQPRVASLLPPVHVALVERSRIVPDLFDLFDRLESRAAPLPPNLTLITGPSKTGDIELKLTTGVHGPGVWHVVVLDGR